jgi:hypothetical protein
LLDTNQVQRHWFPSSTYTLQHHTATQLFSLRLIKSCKMFHTNMNLVGIIEVDISSSLVLVSYIPPRGQHRISLSSLVYTCCQLT